MSLFHLLQITQIQIMLWVEQIQIQIMMLLYTSISNTPLSCFTCLIKACSSLVKEQKWLEMSAAAAAAAAAHSM